MPKWIVDFEGYVILTAEDREEADLVFQQYIAPAVDSPILTENYVVTNIEMYEPAVRQLSMFDEEYGL
jgi:hypothetical protein